MNILKQIEYETDNRIGNSISRCLIRSLKDTTTLEKVNELQKSSFSLNNGLSKGLNKLLEKGNFTKLLLRDCSGLSSDFSILLIDDSKESMQILEVKIDLEQSSKVKFTCSEITKHPTHEIDRIRETEQVHWYNGINNATISVNTNTKEAEKILYDAILELDKKYDRYF